jgi:hypothetical protein
MATELTISAIAEILVQFMVCPSSLIGEFCLNPNLEGRELAG